MDAPLAPAAAPPPGPVRARSVGRTLALVAVAAMVAMWAYVLYLAFGPGRADPPDRLDHPTFARDAEATCSAALDRIAALPLAIEATSAEERAEVLEVANGHLARMLDEVQGCLADEFDVEHSTIQFEARSHGAHEHDTHA